ncbi:hypothetical protein F4801DRAFT_527773 [Xylaria longipes]|nr:hypothetical protein F4801DRAFT_527773 [Xylaria longipes]
MRTCRIPTNIPQLRGSFTVRLPSKRFSASFVFASSYPPPSQYAIHEIYVAIASIGWCALSGSLVGQCIATRLCRSRGLSLARLRCRRRSPLFPTFLFFLCVTSSLIQ